MARIPARRSTAAEKAQLAEAIARTHQRLRQLEAQQRREAKAAYQAQLLAAGKVVEACGLLDVEAGELEAVLKAFPVHRRNFVRWRAPRPEARARPARRCSSLCNAT